MTLTPTPTGTSHAPAPSSDTAEAMRQYLELMRKPGGISDEMRGQLQAAQADIDREAEAVQRSAQDLSRARVMVEYWRSELARCETDERAAIEQHRQVLESWILSRNSGAPPTAAPSDNTVIAKRRAEVSFEAAKQVLAGLERPYSDNREKKQAAEDRLKLLEQAAADAREHELVDGGEEVVSLLVQIGQILYSRRNTQRSQAFLSTPIMLPLVEQMEKATPLMMGGEAYAGGIVADINSSVAGDARGWRLGHEHWAEFRAMLKGAACQSAEESTAETNQEHSAERAA